MARSAGKAMAKLPAARSGPTGAGVGLWWGGLGCGATVMLSPATAILLAVLLSPVLLVTLLPQDAPGQHPTPPVGRRIVLASLLFGLAGSVSPLRQLWTDGATTATMMTIIHRPMVLLVAWTAVLCGWFAGEVAGLVLRITADLDAAAKRRACKAELATLEEEWGPLPQTAGSAPG